MKSCSWWYSFDRTELFLWTYSIPLVIHFEYLDLGIWLSVNSILILPERLHLAIGQQMHLHQIIFYIYFKTPETCRLLIAARADLSV
jgi:hypothetical protein